MSAPTQDQDRDHSTQTRSDGQPAGAALNGLAFSATLHCLTGCAIGEVTGMAIGTALGWGNLQTIALAVALAFLFGYALTAVPLVRARLGFGTVVTTAFASDTVSIAIMEAIDNLFVVAIPGAMEAGLGDWLFWAAIAGGFAVSFPFAFLANRYMIARGKGHACVHAHLTRPQRRRISSGRRQTSES